MVKEEKQRLSRKEKIIAPLESKAPHSASAQSEEGIQLVSVTNHFIFMVPDGK